MRLKIFLVVLVGLQFGISACFEPSGSNVETPDLGTSDGVDGGGDSGACKANCAAKECGDDGCGGQCGQCDANHQCSAEGLCLLSCTQQCKGKSCGDDGCGGQCGQCPQGWQCLQGNCCLPECSGKECGDDGCGGSCGTCDPDQVCGQGQCCLPQCDGRECGLDGCGGSCGNCNPGFKCSSDGLCQCQPNCMGKECGDDGCGGSCGTCESGSCTGGHCNCVPDCTGKNCGDDGCGGFCGFCWPECSCGDDGICHGELGNFQLPCNSTLIDPASGLMWELVLDPTGKPSLPYDKAKKRCADLELGGHTDWRLPAISELRTLIRGCPGTVTGGACTVHDGCNSAACLNEACLGCTALGGPGDKGLYLADGLTTGVETHYWSATQINATEKPAFVVEFNSGKIGTAVTSVTYKAVLCVRK